MKNLIIALSLLILVFGFGQDKEIQGQVVQVQEIANVANEGDIIQLRVQTQNREMIAARIGPKWFLDRDIEIGEELILYGTDCDDSCLQVREMVRNQVRYRLRGADGEPLWIRTQLRAEKSFYNPKNERSYKGRIDDLFVDAATGSMEARLRLEDGELKGETVQVRFAPEWFLRNQLRVGDEIELRGAGSQGGSQTIMAREMRNMRTRLEIALRNGQGFPMWRQDGDQNHGQPGSGMGKKEHDSGHR
jgi:hypothetical protein